MNRRLLALTVIFFAGIACQKSEDIQLVEDQENPIHEGYYLNGAAHLENPGTGTRSWNYSTAQSGKDVFKFDWADNAFAKDGSARFEGYYSVGGNWSLDRSILHNASHPTYVEADMEGNTNIHVALGENSWNDYAHMLLVYSGHDVNHVYWQEDPDEAQVSISDDRHSISFQFGTTNKDPIYVIGEDNYEVLYGVSAVPSSAVSSETGAVSGNVNFTFKHLESVFRVRVKNTSDIHLPLGVIRVMATQKNAGGKGKEGEGEDDYQPPFARDIRLTYTDSGHGASLDGGQFTIEPLNEWGYASAVSDFEVMPLNSMPAMEPGGAFSGDFDYYVVEPGGLYSAYLTPFGNPLSDIREWTFDFSVHTVDPVLGHLLVGKVTVDGSDIAAYTGVNTIAPGYFYTVGIKLKSPYVEIERGGNTLRFVEYSEYVYVDGEYRQNRAMKLVGNSSAPYTGDLVIPASIEVDGALLPVRTIERFACRGYDGLTSVTFPEGMTSVGEGAFKDCAGLETVVMSNSMTKLDREVFKGCVSLNNVTLSNQLRSLTASFQDCSSLQTLVIPASVTSLSTGDFIGCRNLRVTFENTSDDAPYYADAYGAVYARSIPIWDTNYKGKTLLWIPENLTGSYSVEEDTRWIPTGGFKYLSLTSLEIPVNVQYLGWDIFDTVPDKMTLVLRWKSPGDVVRYGDYRWPWMRYSSSWGLIDAQRYFRNMWNNPDFELTISVPSDANASYFTYGSPNYGPWNLFPFTTVVKRQ